MNLFNTMNRSEMATLNHILKICTPREQKSVLKLTPVQKRILIKNFNVGRKVELEHTKIQNVADRTSLDHLVKEGFLDYYDHLIPLEKKLKKEWKR